MIKIRNLAAILFYVCALATSVQAQTTSSPSPTPTPFPNTDIFVVDVTGQGTALKFGMPRRATTWEGYDNQPSFTPDGRSILYTSIRADNQADIYQYNLSDNSTARLTETPEAEYSPTVTPDGKFFSVIRVEKDKDATQRLWKFPLKGGAPSIVLANVKPVGYHVWADERTLALFILGRPVTLQVIDAKTGEYGVIATNIGRSLHRVPNTRKVTYVHKQSPEEWWIKEYDTASHAKGTLTRTLAGSEDYAWTPDGSLLMAKGAKLYRLRPGVDKDWQEAADFAGAGVAEITRISVSPRGDRLAFVARPDASR